MARCSLYLFGGGATLGLVAILFFELEPQADRAGLLANVGGSYLMAGILLLFSRRLPLWSFQAVALVGIALVTLAMFSVATPATTTRCSSR